MKHHIILGAITHISEPGRLFSLMADYFGLLQVALPSEFSIENFSMSERNVSFPTFKCFLTLVVFGFVHKSLLFSGGGR